jgi:uncharacterized protein (TIGR02271 family)
MPTITRSTLVAVFRTAADAQAAANELKANGFSQDDIYMSSDYAQPAAAEGIRERHEGGVVGWLKRVLGHEDETDQTAYETAVHSGNTIVSVEVNNDNLDRAADILNRHSPIDVHHGSGETVARAGTAARAAAAPATDAAADQQRAIPVVQEELQVGKRAVLRGGVRIYSRVVEQPVEETVRLREERVAVERQPVDRPATEADIRGRDQVVEMREYAEEPVVSKQARVVEEVHVGKEASERAETVKDTVRHTEVRVEDLNQANAGRTMGADINEDFRRDFAARYESSAGAYEDYAPSYRYGYEMASDPRYQGRDFSEVEADLRNDYGRRYPNSTWDKMKESIRYGWDKVRGRTSRAAAAR